MPRSHSPLTGEIEYLYSPMPITSTAHHVPTRHSRHSHSGYTRPHWESTTTDDDAVSLRPRSVDNHHYSRDHFLHAPNFADSFFPYAPRPTSRASARYNNLNSSAAPKRKRTSMSSINHISPPTSFESDDTVLSEKKSPLDSEKLSASPKDKDSWRKCILSSHKLRRASAASNTSSNIPCSQTKGRTSSFVDTPHTHIHSHHIHGFRSQFDGFPDVQRDDQDDLEEDDHVFAREEDEDDDEQEDPDALLHPANAEWTPTCTQSLRRQWQAIALTVRFSVFRAQRRMKRRFSL